MKKIMILAVLLSVVMSVSAQMYTFETELCIDVGETEAEVFKATLTIKDGAWVTDGRYHTIMGNTFVKDVLENGNVYFKTSGIDWEGDAVTVSLIPNATEDYDALALKWSDEKVIWYFGELKEEK